MQSVLSYTECALPDAECVLSDAEGALSDAVCVRPMPGVYCSMVCTV